MSKVCLQWSGVVAAFSKAAMKKFIELVSLMMFILEVEEKSI